jgi:sodium transport system permease protein
MRWSMIRLIWFRELRDQLRDRRTVFMIAVLPLILYPVLGTAVIQIFTAGIGDAAAEVGIQGREHLPASPGPTALMVQLAAPSLTAAGAGVPAEHVAGALARAHNHGWRLDYPPLLDGNRFRREYFDSETKSKKLRLRPVGAEGLDQLEKKQLDVVLVIPPNFAWLLEQGGRPDVIVHYRPNDERSRLAAQRVMEVLLNWKQWQREVRLARHGLSAEVVDTFELRHTERDKSSEKRAAEGLFDLLLRIFPFLLVMWSLAGALYPAVDVCAGEKERGTMETLLISPAAREEIVWGKFLTIWVFSASTAMLNVLSMGLTIWQFSGTLGEDATPGPDALLWCVLLLLPLSAFFSALCLAMGAYARSSKEGQYYLMPLFLVTMPLVFLTLAPGVELNPFYSLVPVTGVALLLRRLMESSIANVPWLYFLPVLLPIVLYSWLALRWAIEQFKREEVLFREAERLDIALWLRRLFREKEPVPTVGEAVFCFALVVALRWLSFAWGSKVESFLTHTAVTLVAFVAAPTLLMALVLTTRPLQGLGLQPARPGFYGLSLLLALALLWPLAELTTYLLAEIPKLKELLIERHRLVDEFQELRASGSGFWWYALVLAVLPAISEELLFRGFLLTGLRRRFQPLMAIFLSSLLFGLYHLNVFQFLPAVLLGLVLGLLTVKSGSILPAMVYHLLHNGVQIYLTSRPSLLSLSDGVSEQFMLAIRVGAAIVSALVAAFLLGWLVRLPEKPAVSQA